MFIYYNSSGRVISLSVKEDITLGNNTTVEFLDFPEQSIKSSDLLKTHKDRLSVSNFNLLMDGVTFYSFNEVKSYKIKLLKEKRDAKLAEYDSSLLEYVSMLIEQDNLGVTLTYPIKVYNSLGEVVSLSNKTQLLSAYSNKLQDKVDFVGNILKTYREKLNLLNTALSISELRDTDA